MEGERTARVAGTGSWLPSQRLDNRALFRRDTIRRNFDVERARGSLRGVENVEALSAEDVFDEWSRQVTGIRERRILPHGEGLTTEHMCAEAARRALAMAGMEAAELDLVLVASVTPSDEVPNMACTVAELLDVPRLAGYTLNAACSGYVHGLGAGWASIRSGLARHVLAISGDALSRVTDYSDPKTAVLFGDGAGAAVLVPSTEKDGILGVPGLLGDYDRAPLYMVGRSWTEEGDPPPTLRMGGGPKILRAAISAMAEAGARALESAGLTWADVDVVIPHQANLRITRGLERHLPLEKGRVIHNIECYGNMSASTVAVTLDETIRGAHGPLPDPATVVLTAVGGGYASGAVVLRWEGGVRSDG